MTAQRLPIYPGEMETRFSKNINHKPLASGVRYFDHCRWIFHNLEKQGKRVEITSFKPLHPKIATLGNMNTHRTKDWVGNESLISRVAIAHEEFWKNKEVRGLLNEL
jgi:hypothetical protein